MYGCGEVVSCGKTVGVAGAGLSEVFEGYALGRGALDCGALDCGALEVTGVLEGNGVPDG